MEVQELFHKLAGPSGHVDSSKLLEHKADITKVCHSHLVHEQDFLSALEETRVASTALDLQGFLEVFQGEVDLAAKESWLLHDMRLLRSVAKLLPRGEPGDALAGLAAMTKDNHDLLSIEIAKHVTAFLHTVRADTRELETSPANCSPFEAEACPGEKCSQDQYAVAVDTWQSKVQLAVNEAEYRLKKMVEAQAQFRELQAELQSAKDLKEAQERLANAEPRSDESREAALALCVMHGILQQGEEVDMTNDLGETRLVTACANGFPEDVRLLLQAGASALATNTHGQSPLLESAFLGHREIVCDLLAFGAEVDHRDPNSGMTALESAAMEGMLDCVQVLLDAKADVNVRDKDQDTPLLQAVGGGHLECARLLLASSADVQATNKENISALMLAAQQDDLACVRLLLENRADVNTKDKDGDTALKYALHNGSKNKQCAGEILREIKAQPGQSSGLGKASGQ